MLLHTQCCVVVWPCRTGQVNADPLDFLEAHSVMFSLVFYDFRFGTFAPAFVELRVIWVKTPYGMNSTQFFPARAKQINAHTHTHGQASQVYWDIRRNYHNNFYR